MGLGVLPRGRPVLLCVGKGQPAARRHRLDLPPAAENAAEVGRGVATTLAEAVSDPPDNRGIYARLNDRDEWELYGPFGVPSVYDAESGLRWENHGRRYVPVSHTRGYRWTADGEGYSPAASFLPLVVFPIRPRDTEIWGSGSRTDHRGDRQNGRSRAILGDGTRVVAHAGLGSGSVRGVGGCEACLARGPASTRACT